MWQDLKNIYHLLVAVLANLWFGFPSKKLVVIGVTGTDGKTTTTYLIYHILKQVGKRVSMVSSVGAYIGDKQYETGFHVTTPSSWQLQKFLKKASYLPDKRFLVLEVTSHALDQYRIWGIDFAVGVLTNVTHEHLDYHGTYEKYVTAKAKLLGKAKIAVVNRDDKSYEILNSKYKIAKIHSKNTKWRTYGLKENADINPLTFSFKTKFLGEFNLYNCLAAIAATKALGVSDKIIRGAILSFTLPIGRLDIVYEGDFKVVVDMAHTPNGLENVLSAVKPTVRGRFIHVFGSAGERDKAKRPKMGEISAKYADVIVLTAEDPRSESAKKIIEEITLGIKNQELRIKKGELYEVPDRQEAINFAVSLAKKQDFVLITGKGHERSMTYGKKDYPWSEHEAVKKALKLRKL